jgi:hypothetical protein
VGLDANAHMLIRDLWKEHSARAAQQAETLSAEDFARAFVEANLPPEAR